MVALRAHGPVMIAQPPELSTNKPGKISSNLIKIDNYDEMVTCGNEPVMRDDRPCHCHVTPCHEIGMSVTWRGMVVMRHDKIDVRRGLLTVLSPAKTPA